jgi:acyl carrier protein
MKEHVLNLIFALQSRLAAKQPMYEADEEWRDISAAIRALENLVSKGWVK